MAVGAAFAAASATRLLKDINDDSVFAKAVYNAGFATCAAIAAAVADAPTPLAMGMLAGAFAGGMCAMYSGVRLASTGVRLSDGAKAAILTVASLPLAVASGVAGSKFCKLAFNILGAIG